MSSRYASSKPPQMYKCRYAYLRYYLSHSVATCEISESAVAYLCRKLYIGSRKKQVDLSVYCSARYMWACDHVPCDIVRKAAIRGLQATMLDIPFTMIGEQVKFPQLNSIEHCLGEQAEQDEGDGEASEAEQAEQDEASVAEQAEPDEADGSSDEELPAEDKDSDFDFDSGPDPVEDEAPPPPEYVEDDRGAAEVPLLYMCNRYYGNMMSDFHIWCDMHTRWAIYKRYVEHGYTDNMDGSMSNMLRYVPAGQWPTGVR